MSERFDDDDRGASDEAREVIGSRPLEGRTPPSLDLDGETASMIADVAADAGASDRSSGDEASALLDDDGARRERRRKNDATVDQLEQQIRDLEARLDAMIDLQKPRPKDEAKAPLDGGTVVDRKPPTLRARVEDTDDFGLDPQFEASAQPLLDFLYRTYFRVETRGLENLPERGRCLVVANHSGGPLPYDGLMLRAAILREQAAGSARDVRWLAEDFVYYLPFVGTAMNRLGAVRACQENAQRLLAEDKTVAVFPEGAKGIGKLFAQRYKLQRFGRGGFIRLALRTGTPLVPCAIVGAEEVNPILARFEGASKSLGLPYFPVTPIFPLLGPAGLLPAPTKWRIVFGERMSFDGLGPDAAEDDVLVGRLSERVRGTLQAMIDKALGERRSVWFG